MNFGNSGEVNSSGINGYSRGNTENFTRAGVEPIGGIHRHMAFNDAGTIEVNPAFASGGMGSVHGVLHNGRIPVDIVAKIPLSTDQGFLASHLGKIQGLLASEFGIEVDYPTQEDGQDLSAEAWFLNSKSVLDCCRIRLENVNGGADLEELSPLGIYESIQKELHNLLVGNSGEYQLAYFIADEHLREYFMYLECLWRYQNIYGTEGKFSDSIPTYPLPIVHGLGFHIAGFSGGQALFTTAIVMDKLSGSSYRSAGLGSSVKDSDFVEIKYHCQEFFRTLGIEHGDLSRANVMQRTGRSGENQLEIIDLGKAKLLTYPKFASVRS